MRRNESGYWPKTRVSSHLRWQRYGAHGRPLANYKDGTRPTTEEPPREFVRRALPVPPPVAAIAALSSFGDYIEKVMAFLRAVKSSEITDFARDIELVEMQRTNTQS
ncbi:hypothetical protein EVAR_34658_1 [Eumeta japonica]|uniref:Uncharacterized protein n=1 Tax=Eumeta variegata TaxID=151549 RepID=A0A4C1VGN5_EUMVA|nr:hypothetical protein EVAR_34658_1 [Eumeta japonica]